MQCPVCENLLSSKTVDQITVDVCKGGCAGIWFDNFEFKKFDEPHEATGTELLDIETNEKIQVDHSARRNCPKCSDTIMMRNFFSTKRQIEVDTCPQCAGVWLDARELASIRTQFDSEEARKEAAGEMFRELFGSQLAQMKRESEEKAAQARRFARVFRFICPSYYIPGDQEWGAY